MNSFVESLRGWPLALWWFFVVMGFIGSMVFPVLYHFGSRGGWRRSEMGRHLMTFSVAVGVGLAAYLSRIALGDYPGRTAIMFGALVFLVCVVWWRSLLYLKVRRGQSRGSGRHEMV